MGPGELGETLGTWSKDQWHLWPKYLAVITRHLDWVVLFFSVVLWLHNHPHFKIMGRRTEHLIGTAAAPIGFRSLCWGGENEVQWCYSSVRKDPTWNNVCCSLIHGDISTLLFLPCLTDLPVDCNIFKQRNLKRLTSGCVKPNKNIRGNSADVIDPLIWATVTQDWNFVFSILEFPDSEWRIGVRLS